MLLDFTVNFLNLSNLLNKMHRDKLNFSLKMMMMLTTDYFSRFVDVIIE